MSDTLTNIPLPKNIWVDLYAGSGVQVGTQILVENTGVCDVQLAVQATEPAKDSLDFNILKREGDPLQNQPGDSGAWAYCANTDGQVNVNPVIMNGFAPVVPLAAVKTTDESGRVSMVSMTGEMHVGFKVDDISVNFQYGISTSDIVNGGEVTGNGVIGTDGAMATVSTGVDIGSAQIESRDAVRYRAGHECHCALSTIFATPDVNVNQYAGFLNGDDAWCPGYQGLDFGIWFIEGGNITFIVQDDFTVDKLDGFGPSGYDINAQTMQLFRSSYTWHGGLPMHIEISTDGGFSWFPVTTLFFVNTAIETHLENPNLPITVKIERVSGTGPSLTIKTGSWRGGVIAGVEENNSSDRWFAFFNLDRAVSTSIATSTHLLSLRSMADFQLKINHIKTEVKILVSTSSYNKDLVVAAVPTFILRGFDPVFAAALDAAYVDVNTLNSVIEIAKLPTSVDLTNLVDSDIADVALVQSNRSRENLDIDGFVLYPEDEISFVVIPAAGGSGSISLQGNFKELH